MVRVIVDLVTAVVIIVVAAVVTLFTRVSNRSVRVYEDTTPTEERPYDWKADGL